MSPITGRITSIEFLTNREDGFCRFGIADHPAPHVVLLGHEATITIDGSVKTFPELLAWIARKGGVSTGTFHPDAAKYFAASQAEFVSG